MDGIALKKSGCLSTTKDEEFHFSVKPTAF